MSTSFDLPDVDRLTTGAIGPPGERVFYLQATAADQVVSLKVEKTQVAALVGYLEALLSDLSPPGELPADIAEWVVGSLGVSYDEVDDRIVLLAEELVEEGEEGAVARLRATREQVTALIAHGNEVVQAGRPPCPLCGNPLDPEGHVCPRLNGHRRATA